MATNYSERENGSPHCARYDKEESGGEGGWCEAGKGEKSIHGGRVQYNANNVYLILIKI